VRSASDMWLEASGVAVRLAIGWAQPMAGGRLAAALHFAQPIAGGRLADALRLADDRMNADRRRQCIRGAPTTAAPLIDDEDPARL